jgi:hypothetical protein
MLDLFIPSSTRRLVLYPVPINVRWGPDRLRVACERDPPEGQKYVVLAASKVASLFRA